MDIEKCVIERKQERRKLDYCAPLLHVDALDQISQLPEHIIHHILFFMPHKDAALTTSMLYLKKTSHN